MKTLTTLTIIIALTAGAALAGTGNSSAPGNAWSQREGVTSSEAVNVLILMDDDGFGSELSMSANSREMSRAERIVEVTSRLRARTTSAEPGVISYLQTNDINDYTKFWIAPIIQVTVTADQAADLEQLPGVSRVLPNVELDLIAPVEMRFAPAASTAVSTQLDMLNVPVVWNQGIDGSGALVCSFDTGVDGDHPALQSKWRGNQASVAATWYAPVLHGDVPTDRSGHGSHTMGIMVGSEPGDTVGVAPGAQWIAAAVVDQGKTLSATIADILAAFQWTLNPDGDWATTNDVPDVILNSWGIPAGLFGDCDNTFWTAIDNVEAAGIVTIFAAGNEGPDPSSLRSPGDRTTSPINSFAVGAVNDLAQIASFSSRGPSLCDTTAVKPEVVAPGTQIRSASKDGGYVVMSGTSMAAPYIAGLVALCRDYAPDATVEEIKWAILESAQDLGPVGEDNTYGWGLPDAALMLTHLDAPTFYTAFDVNEVLIGDDGIAEIGTESDFHLILTNSAANLDAVTTNLISLTDGVTVIGGTSQFVFGSNGTTAVNLNTLSVALDNNLINGDSAEFLLEVSLLTGQVIDTLDFAICTGYAPTGTSANLNSGSLELTVSDFAQYGLGASSIYNVGGTGMSYLGSDNLLYESGIVIGRNGLQLSTSVRRSDGTFKPSDFEPVSALSDLGTDSDGGHSLSCRFSDSRADIVLPITVRQKTTEFGGGPLDGTVLFTYTLINDSPEMLSNVSLGFFTDFDFGSGTEQIKLYNNGRIAIHDGATGVQLAVSSVTDNNRIVPLTNSGGKAGYTGTQWYDLISSTAYADTLLSGADLMMVATAGSYDLAAFDSVTVAFAVLAGTDTNELLSRLDDIDGYFASPTDITDNQDVLPVEFSLAQNYPNPFNPTTTIGFSLATASDVRLEVYNVIGQRVSTLVESALPAGEHEVVWDGMDSRGDEVASGVYFYRLTTGATSATRKMILLR